MYRYWWGSLCRVGKVCKSHSKLDDLNATSAIILGIIEHLLFKADRWELGKPLILATKKKKTAATQMTLTVELSIIIP